ncbi:MAG: TonB C-terminal domain-containing protein [Gemmatimonas sp.]
MTAPRPAFIEPVRTRRAEPRAARKPHTFGWGMTVSVALHIAALAALVIWKGMAPPARPPQYRIELVGAAGLKRQMGVVADQQPDVATPTPAVAPKAAERPPDMEKKVVPKTKAKAEPKPVKATPNQTKTKPPPAAAAATRTATKAAPPVAGSGQTKGRGTDVTNMVVEGIQFPFPYYIENIQRQLAIAFGDWTKGGDLVAEFRFVILRDGSVPEIKLLTSSGNRQFDLQGRGAIESVGNKRLFNPLPDGFSDESLPVYYTFRPDKNLF